MSSTIVRLICSSLRSSARRRSIYYLALCARPGSGIEIELPGARVALPPSLTQEKLGLNAYLDRELIVGVRPEAALLTDGSGGELAGVVAFQEDLGANMITTVDLAAGERRDGAVVEDLAESGVPRVSNRLRINTHGGARRRVDEPVSVVLDLKRLHFFDPVSKLAIH